MLVFSLMLGEEGDYIDFVIFEESQVLQWISEADHLLGYINGLIEKESV